MGIYEDWLEWELKRCRIEAENRLVLGFAKQQAIRAGLEYGAEKLPNGAVMVAEHFVVTWEQMAASTLTKCESLGAEMVVEEEGVLILPNGGALLFAWGPGWRDELWLGVDGWRWPETEDFCNAPGSNGAN